MGLLCAAPSSWPPVGSGTCRKERAKQSPRGAPDTVGKGVRVDGPHMDAEFCVGDVGLLGAVLPQQACHAHTFHHRVS